MAASPAACGISWPRRSAVRPPRCAPTPGSTTSGSTPSRSCAWGGELEELVGETLYPTLLFEFGDIASLARHLSATYPVTLSTAVTGPSAPPSTVEHTLEHTVGTYRDVRAPIDPVSPAPVSPAPVDDVLLIGGPTPTVPVTTDLAATLDRRLATAGLPSRVVVDADDPARTLWTVATALVRRCPDRTVTVLVAAPADPARAAAVAALAETIGAEVPALRCRVVETGEAPDRAGRLLAESGDRDAGPWVRYRAGTRQVRRWTPVDLPAPAAPPFRAGAGYLVTGGTGGLARLLAAHLAVTRRARVVLAGRGDCPPELAERIERWRADGAEVHYVRGDVSRVDGARSVAAAARTVLGRVDGVLHCAGSVHDGLFFHRDPADLAVTGAAKVDGTAHLDAATRDDDLDMFVLFSSLAGVVPNPGQADYAHANAYQYAYAEPACGPGPDARDRVAAVGRRRDARPAPTRRPLDRHHRHGAAAHRRRASTYWSAALASHALRSRCRLRRSGPHVDVLPAVPAKVRSAVPRRAPRPGTWPSPSIGMAGRYPGADDLDAFWHNLATGRDCVTEVPADRWDHARYFDPDPAAPGRTYSRWGGFLDGVDQFDPRSSASRAATPSAWTRRSGCSSRPPGARFEDAGYAHAGRLGRRAVGVFVGVMWNHYQLVDRRPTGVAPTAMHAVGREPGVVLPRPARARAWPSTPRARRR